MWHWDLFLFGFAATLLGWSVAAFQYQRRLRKLHQNWEVAMTAMRGELHRVREKIHG
jgi:hypothetical protein